MTTPTSPSPRPDPAAISARAHALYVARGSRPGRALDDWLEAERELTAALAPKATTPAPAKGSPPPAPAARASAALAKVTAASRARKTPGKGGKRR
jgi:hypothetical protein